MNRLSLDRREFLRDVGSAAMLGMLPGALEAAAGQPSRPNVLFIAVDDLRPVLGCYGDRAALTPNIDKLAARGIRFSRAYCQQAVCNPSRQSALTGRRPDTIRVWDQMTHFRATLPRAVTLPQHFKNHGYHTLSLGKVFHGGAPMNDPPSWSVPEQFLNIPKREDYRLKENRIPHPPVGKTVSTEFVEADDDAYPDGQIAAGTVKALEDLAHTGGGAPFFIAVGFHKPHLPYTAPKQYWDLHDSEAIPPPPHPEPVSNAPPMAFYDSFELRGYLDIPQKGPLPAALIQRLRRGYYSAASFTDAQIGRVLSALQRTGLDRNTIVVLWCDHGYHLGELGMWSKLTNYEGATRVPLIVARPGEKRPGETCHSLVELIDIYPTLSDMCHLPAPAGLEGRSLLPWLDHPARPGRRAAFSQFPRPWFDGPGRPGGYNWSPRPWFTSVWPEHMGYAVRTEDHRYVEWRRIGTRDVVARELYSYRDNPNLESVNLASDPAETARLGEMSALLPR